MISEAEANADADREAREQAEIRNNAEQSIYLVERQMQAFQDKLSGEQGEQLESHLSEVREALKGDDYEYLQEVTDALVQSSHKTSELIYQTAQAEAESVLAEQMERESEEDGSSSSPS